MCQYYKVSFEPLEFLSQTGLILYWFDGSFFVPLGEFSSTQVSLLLSLLINFEYKCRFVLFSRLITVPESKKEDLGGLLRTYER